MHAASPIAIANTFSPVRPRGWKLKENAGPTPRPANVRVMRPDEEGKVFAVLMRLASENALAPVSDAKVHAMIQRCRGPKAGEYRDGVVGIIDAPNGSIAATVGIVMGQWWYTEAWHCEEVWSFVVPEYRQAKRNYARNIIQFGKWWTEQMGCPLLGGVLSTTRTLGKVRLYAREMPLVGALFLWRGNSVI